MTAPSLTPAYDALELNHQRFVDAVLTSPSAAAAYAKVYEVDAASARASAARLLANVSIQEALDERRALAAARTTVTAERIIEEVAAIAFSSMRTFASWGPSGVTLVDDTMLTDADARCIAEVSETRGKDGTPMGRIKLHPKQPALDKLAEWWAIDQAMIKRLFPDLGDEELQDGVLSILKTARDRHRAAKAAQGGT